MKYQKRITTIEGAIKELTEIQDLFSHGFNMQLLQSRMDEIFDFYFVQIKACMLLALEKNPASQITYCTAINSVRYFEVHIHVDSSGATIFIGKEMLGVPTQAKDFQDREANKTYYWSQTSADRLIEAFTLLQLYFNHLNNENLYKQNGTIS
ncbi:hypothetical protein [Dyadobacter sp. CY343]|uniref:hypothetical protein n=1 Tax=Dyadobacter sp. CY343 TaxID=2907299 RepID=UPI001F2CFB04|nr:hypothetical protein [Dyadobacter sp. CY343]MCE7061235.1 hypothetical protein [Dyadobacter sp. CY343]